MNNKIYNRAVALNKDVDNYIKNSFDEILSSIYSCSITEEAYDEIIDEYGNIIKSKLKINDDDLIDWRKVEDTFYNKYHCLTNILDYTEVKKAISKSKILRDDWEDIDGELPIERINKIFISEFKENINFFQSDYAKSFLLTNNE